MNPFDVLEISPDASPDEIKAAYHRLAKQWHPDRFSGDEKAEAETRFRELAEAFSALKDPVKRAIFVQQAPKPQAQGTVPSANSQESVQERTPLDWATMAKAALEEGNVDQARALIHYAIRMDEGKASFHTLLAAILEHDGGDLRAVVKALETAVRLAPQDVESHIKLGMHFRTLGLEARSRRHLQLARELAPHHPKLKQAAPERSVGGSVKSSLVTGRPQSLAEGVVNQLKDLWGRLTGKG